MWRSVVLGVSSNAVVRQLVTRSGFGRRTALRFVAGETIDRAIAAARDLSLRGASAELDYLGEHVVDERQTSQVVSTYLDMLDRIASAGIPAQVSLKPSQMGQELGDDLSYENLRSVVEKAASHRNFVWIDMEGSAYTELTIQLYRRLRARHDNVGIALQAYLYRTRADVESLLAIGGTVRLCKGAYSEPPDVAFPHKREVDLNFKLLAEVLLSSRQYHAIATHDEKMIRHAVEFARAEGVDSRNFEFQMLYGIRRDLQAQLLRDGYNLRVYVPYGEQWYPYLMRRLAERPANLLFLVRNVVAEARSGAP